MFLKEKGLTFRFGRLGNGILTKLRYKVVEIDISSTFHYCGFQYGRHPYNPYERYIRDYHERISRDKREPRFIKFLSYYRPTSFAEALGLTLDREYRLWQFPWGKKYNDDYDATDMALMSIPDIMTHFSQKGIPYHKIKEEFRWLESAYDSILRWGYRPDKFGYAEALQLWNGELHSYILTDGNHRVSALSALGQTRVKVRISRFTRVNREDYWKWPGVRNGIFTESDALKIFDVYFIGNKRFKTTIAPAKVLGMELPNSTIEV